MLFGLLKADRDWMVSRTAQRRFLLSSLSSLFVFGLVEIVSHLWGWDYPFTGSPFLQVGVFVLGVTWVMGTLSIIFGMWWYCWRVDSSRWRLKALWMILFFFAPLVSQIVYYFLVYRAQTSHTKVVRET